MYFNLPIQDDITYLLGEIGHNCKVNNISAKAIVNNTNNDYDDKRIITNEELKRGYYINYSDLFFLVIDDVVDHRYKTYYKSKMRKCNHDIKFIVENKLYLFPGIVESEKFSIDAGKLINMAADTISVTLPSTDITKKIKQSQRFIKFNMAWKIQGLDYTKDGLVTLFCVRDIVDLAIDDVKNEIADRYVGGDVLDGDIRPIPPFAQEPAEPLLYRITILVLDEAENLIKDATITLKDDNGNIISPEIDDEIVFFVESGLYTYSVTKEGYSTNTGNIEVINNHVYTITYLEEEISEPPEPSYSITISGSDKIMVGLEDIYTAKVFDNDVEVTDKEVRFEVDKTNLAKIISQGNNQCTVKANSDFNFGNVTLKAILVDYEEVFAEKKISITGF